MSRNLSTPERTSMTLERWHRMLDDVAERRDLPRLYRDNLIEAADDMLRADIIDPMEHFDLVELANAAYSHEIEEQVILYRYFRHSGYYDVGSGDQRIGILRGVRFYLEKDQFREPASYHARIEHTDNGLELITSQSSRSLGVIHGKRFVASTGEQHELFETCRIIASTDTQAINDPDIYRLALDAIQHAAEEGDIERHGDLVQRASVSIFMPCPGCDDSFSRREDCGECEGLGFVRETPARFRWRS